MALSNLGLGFVFTAKDLATGAIKKLEGKFTSLEGTSDRAAKTFKRAVGGFTVGIGLLAMAIGGVFAFDRAVDEAAKFGTAVAEVTTIIDEAVFPAKRIREETIALAAAFGGDPASQAKALYQAISAGATDAAAATETVTQANVLAVGGLTDAFTAINILTTATNVYADANLQAGEASDSLFTAVRLGKTTVAELGRSLGRVLPVAKSVGIGFDEVNAAVAAMTANGLATSAAVTGMNAAIANILRPTKDAKDEAKRLGIQFNDTALRSKGLAGFLDSVTSSAGFNESTLKTLFSSIEGLNAITSLTANSSAKFADALVQMESKAGASQAAFEKVSATLEFQERRFAALRSAALITIGEIIEPLVVKLVKGMSVLLDAFVKLPKPIKVFMVVATFAAIVITGLVGAILALGSAAALVFTVISTVGAPVLLGIAAVLLPVIALFSALAQAAAGLAVAFETNIGGFGDFVRDIFGRVRLFFRAMTQLFEEGGFSGAVMDELNRAENAGIKQFAIRIFQIGFRISKFLDGLKEGFQAAMQALQPVFDQLFAALSELTETFTGAGEESADFLAAISSPRFKAFGRIVGVVLAGAVGGFVKLLTFAVKVMGFFLDPLDAIADALKETFGPPLEFVAQAFRGMAAVVSDVFDFIMELLSPVFDFIADTFSPVVDLARRVFGTVADIVGESLDAVAGFFLGAFDTISEFLSPVVDAFRSAFKTIADVVGSVFGPVIEFIGDAFDGIRRGLLELVAFAGQVVAKIPAKFRPEALEFVIRQGLQAETALGAIERREGSAAARPLGAAVEQITAMPAAAAVEVAQRGEMFGEAQATALQEAVRRGVEAAEERIERVTRVEIDGEVLAESVQSAQRTGGARGFSPVGEGA